MEEGIGSWFRHQHSDWQCPNLNTLSAPFDLGQQNTVPTYINPSSNLVSTNGTLPMLGSSGVPHSKASQPYEPRGWFYCLPRFRQAFAPVLNSVPKEKLTASPNENCRDLGASGTGSGCAPKRFLVFDQSGDKTNLIFSSGIGTPVNCLPSWLPKPSNAFNLNKEEAGTKRDASISGPFSLDEFNEQDNEDDVRSEMHEDTEELDALLYSDDENAYSEDDEVTSTGYSPSTMAAYDKLELSKESGEEVASSARPAKRQKFSDGGYDMPSLMDAASSVKTNRCFEYDSDAESSCGNSKNQVYGESGSLSGNQRSRKEKIRETISMLESIMPDGKGKEAIVVIDEAIQYLRSLKDKAKALGLDTL